MTSRDKTTAFEIALVLPSQLPPVPTHLLRPTLSACCGSTLYSGSETVNRPKQLGGVQRRRQQRLAFLAYGVEPVFGLSSAVAFESPAFARESRRKRKH